MSAMVQIFSFVSLNGIFHLSLNENICSMYEWENSVIIVVYNFYNESNF